MKISDVTVLACLLFALITAYGINRALVAYSLDLGDKQKTHQGTIRWGSRKKSHLGGISFLVPFLLVVTAFFFLEEEPSGYSPQWVATIAATTLGALIGLYDEAANIKPITKLACQGVCALILIFCGLWVQFSGVFLLDALLSAFWVIAIMNSINMLDNMDGVVGTISPIVILVIGVADFLHRGFNTQNLAMFTLIGGLVGFLHFNWNPSKLYMGEVGSQMLGAFLASISIMFLWRQDSFTGDWSATANLLLPVMLFIVPIIDTSIVSISRLMRGSSPFVGGIDHTTHHLAYYGFSDRYVALFLGLLTLLSGSIYLVLCLTIQQWSLYLTATLVAYCLLLFLLMVFLYQAGGRKKHGECLVADCYNSES